MTVCWPAELSHRSFTVSCIGWLWQLNRCSTECDAIPHSIQTSDDVGLIYVQSQTSSIWTTDDKRWAAGLSADIQQINCLIVWPLTNHLGQLSLPSFHGKLIEYQPVWLGLRQGTFTCVRWQVTLCDPIWQVTSCSLVSSGIQRMIWSMFWMLMYTLCTVDRNSAVHGTRSNWPRSAWIQLSCKSLLSSLNYYFRYEVCPTR